MGHKEWEKDGKTFTRCYTIALKFWDELNANFVLLYFSSYRSIKIWHHSILRNILPWYLKKFGHVLFCVFQTNLKKAVNIRSNFSEWIRNIQMIQCFNTLKTWMRILHGQLKRLKIQNVIKETLLFPYTQ